MELAIMHATLAGCKTAKDEVSLAVAWGESMLLERVLLAHEGVTAAHPAALSQAGRDPFGISAALNLALLSGSPTMMSALIDFGASSAQVDLSRIFVQPLNRYRLKGASSECWMTGGSEINDEIGVSFGGGNSVGRARLTRFNVSNADTHSSSRQDSNDTLGGSSVSSPSRARTRTRRSSMRASMKNMIGLGDHHHDQDPWRILSDWIPHYKTHILVRREKNLLQPGWDDLMLWAVLTRETSMVKPLWARSKEPIRLALSACQFCQRLSALPHLRSEHDALRKQATIFEDWAISVLDAIDDSEAAMPLLTMIPCIDVGTALWSSSTLDLAAEQEIYAGTLISCKRFVAHRHSQFVLEAFFAGDSPKSRARLQLDVGFISVLAQALLFFAPGAICQILPPSQATIEESAAGDHNRYRMTRIDEDDDDADEEALIGKKEAHAFQVIGNAGQRQLTNRISSVTRRQRRSRDEQRNGILSDRWRHFFLVPKVKFVMYAVMHLMYIGVLCLVVFPKLQRPKAATNGTDTGSNLVSLDPETTLSPLEIFFWLWTALFTFAEAKEFKNFKVEGLRQYLRSPWNKLDLISIMSITGAFLLRTTCRPALDLVGDATKSCNLSDSHWARNFYAISLILLFLKVLSYAQIYESVGVHVIILGEVIRADVSVFSVLALIISTGVGTALTLEFDAWISAELNDPSRDFFERPLTMPFWGIVGYFNHYNLPSQAGSADPTRFLVAVIVFLYLIGIVILVNLMIAAMSETYARVRDASALYWLFERAQLIQEFKRKGALPPPLNVLTILIHDLPVGVAYCARSCKCSSVAQKLLVWLHGEDANEEISRDGFRLIPGPSQQQRFQKRLRITLRRCLKRMTAEEEAHLTNQVSELHSLIALARAEAQSNFEHLSLVQATIANGTNTSRSGTSRSGGGTTRSYRSMSTSHKHRRNSNPASGVPSMMSMPAKALHSNEPVNEDPQMNEGHDGSILGSVHRTTSLPRKPSLKQLSVDDALTRALACSSTPSLAEDENTERRERKEATSRERKTRPPIRRKQRVRSQAQECTTQLAAPANSNDDVKRDGTRERRVSLQPTPIVVKMGDFEA